MHDAWSVMGTSLLAMRNEGAATADTVVLLALDTANHAVIDAATAAFSRPAMPSASPGAAHALALARVDGAP
ncbi:hypothetical protein, partial [Paracoccus hibiscisoli]|uniref:hypothetical protein n=1 Tax=Paracoccus hibiscisoli TaxID=2023261 RepID=UPI00391A8DB1